MLPLVLSFIAGLLTAFAPCVLPLLPVILGGSFDAADRDKKRPYIITTSLVVSLVLFTILLKVSTSLIGIDPRVWSIASGVLVIVLGVFMLFPMAWAHIIAKLGIESRSQKALGSAYTNKNKTYSAILTGAALGPVFSSCSPTYAWVIATVLPASAAKGVLYLSVYCIGVAASLLAIALLGRKLLAKVKWATNPHGWFQRTIAIIFILVGVFVATGYDKKVQIWLVDKDVLHLVSLEKKLVPRSNSNPRTSESSKLQTDKVKFNIAPYAAPEIAGVADWINSTPLTLANLKGKVVLIDFWTYSCINCQRTQPYLNKWYDTYEKDGFVIIGMHAPEFAFEKVSSNVQKAVKEDNIKYPVALDNDFTTWRNYDNQFWPAKYLIDKDGYVRYTHFGEGDYAETEAAIQTLLKENGKSVSSLIDTKEAPVPVSQGQSPETYLGYQRGERFVSAEKVQVDTPIVYTLSDMLSEHTWSLGGKWTVGSFETTVVSDVATLRFKFSAKEVYLVMNGPVDNPVTLALNGQKITSNNGGGSDVDTSGNIMSDGARLYKLINLPTFTKNQTLDIFLPKGATVNAFTFGG